jgi:general secretion pathway protein G
MGNFHRDLLCVGIRGSSPLKSIGFTLIEIIVSVVIVGILGAIAMPLYSGYMEHGRVDNAIADIGTISLRIESYYSDHNAYPQSLADVNYDTYRDPWGNPYQYFNNQTGKGNGKARKDRFLVPLNTDYDLYSMGKDGQSKPPLTAKESKDDVIRANNGAYIGPAAGF